MTGHRHAACPPILRSKTLTNVAATGNRRKSYSFQEARNEKTNGRIYTNLLYVNPSVICDAGKREKEKEPQDTAALHSRRDEDND